MNRVEEIILSGVTETYEFKVGENLGTRKALRWVSKIVSCAYCQANEKCDAGKDGKECWEVLKEQMTKEQKNG